MRPTPTPEDAPSLFSLRRCRAVFADCSLCIRRTIGFRSECPTCRAPVAADDLRPNRALEATAEAFKAARADLLALARGGPDEAARTGAGASTPRRSGRTTPTQRTATRRPSRAPAADAPGNASAAARRTTRQSARATRGGASTSPPRVATCRLRPRRNGARRCRVHVEATDGDALGEEDTGAGGEHSDDGVDGEYDDDAEEPLSESDWDPDASQQTADDGPGGITAGRARDRGRVLRAEVVDLLDEEEDANDLEEEAVTGRDGGNTRSGAKRKRGLTVTQPRAGAVTTPESSGQKPRAGTVECPICGISILEGLINSHVDVCLLKGGGGGGNESGSGRLSGGGDGSPAARTAAVPAEPHKQPCTMAKLPKLVYHIMKDKKLKELLASSGLNVSGTRAAMEKRHKEFTLRVNATIDSGHQPNLSAIVREVTKLERDRDRAGLISAVGVSGLTGAAPSAAAPGSSRADTFNKLIASIKQRKPGDGAKPKPPPRKGQGEGKENDGENGIEEHVEGTVGADQTMEDVERSGGWGTATRADDATEEAGVTTKDEDDDTVAALDKSLARDATDAGAETEVSNGSDGSRDAGEEDAVKDSQDSDEWGRLPLSQVPPRGVAGMQTA